MSLSVFKSVHHFKKLIGPRDVFDVPVGSKKGQSPLCVVATIGGHTHRRVQPGGLVSSGRQSYCVLWGQDSRPVS